MIKQKINEIQIHFFIVLVYRTTNKIPGAQVVNFKISPKHKDTVFTNVQSSHLRR